MVSSSSALKVTQLANKINLNFNKKRFLKANLKNAIIK